MKLVKPSIAGRSFLLQFFQIMEEFGNEIPWLNQLDSIAYSTNPKFFKDQFLKRLGCDEEEIIPYQLVKEDAPKEYIGGLLHFHKSPEIFSDFSNIEILERLDSEKYDYISCLQVRSSFRSKGQGTALMEKALLSIRRTHQHFWGVVSHPELIRWYESLGALSLSPAQNKDNLWIVAW